MAVYDKGYREGCRKGYRDACRDVASATYGRVAATRLHIMKALECVRDFDARDLPDEAKANALLACLTLTAEMAVHFLGLTLDFLEAVEDSRLAFYRNLTDT